MSYGEETAHYKRYAVHLNHLELMGIAMALEAEEERDGLSRPQRSAADRIGMALQRALSDLGRPDAPA